MTTATFEEIRAQTKRLQERINGHPSARRKLELENLESMFNLLTLIKAEVQEGLRHGMERHSFLESLGLLRSAAEKTVDALQRTLDIWKSDEEISAATSGKLREAKDILDWVTRLEDRYHTPLPPPDESKLSPSSGDPTAEGYISMSEARTRLGK
jgi:hypothetical protein